MQHVNKASMCSTGLPRGLTFKSRVEYNLIEPSGMVTVPLGIFWQVGQFQEIPRWTATEAKLLYPQGDLPAGERGWQGCKQFENRDIINYHIDNRSISCLGQTRWLLRQRISPRWLPGLERWPWSECNPPSPPPPHRPSCRHPSHQPVVLIIFIIVV